MNFNVYNIFTSIQGEGICTGRKAVFIRLAGCNLSCQFCDTAFTQKASGSLMSDFIISGYVEKALEKINTGYIVITGGEPLIQDTASLCQYLLTNISGIDEISIQTNGTLGIESFLSLDCLDRITLEISPKIPREYMAIDENYLYKFRCVVLKILFPFLSIDKLKEFESYPAHYFYLQPIMPDDKEFSMTKQTIETLSSLGSKWRLSLQIHKFIGIE